MAHLAEELATMEYEYLEKLRAKAPKGYLGEGSSGVEHDLNKRILNYFVWYSVSLVNFLKLFHSAYCPSEDWRQVFSAELKWRNKVAGHTAFSDPRPEDNQPSRDMSVFMSIGWALDHFDLNRWQIGWGPGPNGEDQMSHGDWFWAVTPTHSKLKNYIAQHLPRLEAS